MAEPAVRRRDELALLLRVASHPRAVIGSESVTQWEGGRGLVEKGLLRPYSNRAECIEIDGEDRELVWDSDSGTHRYFSPAMGWANVPTDRLKSYRVDFDALLAVINRWLQIPTHSSPTNLVSELLWELGETWLGRRRVAVLFLRRAGLPKTLSKVHTALQGYPRRGTSLILTDGRPSSYGPDLPGKPMFMYMLDLFPPDKAFLDGIDSDALIFDFGVREPRRKWSPVECGEEGGYLRIHDREYRFSGFTHKRIIRLLHEAWERGEPRLRTASVLEEAESRSRTMSQAFSGCKEDWKEVIGYGDGFCWLKIEDRP
jgi:hypothetical protein